MEKKRIHTPALVLMIVGLVFAFISPLVAYVCCIISIVLAVKNRAAHSFKLVISLAVLALVIAVVNNIYAAMMIMKMQG